MFPVLRQQFESLPLAAAATFAFKVGVQDSDTVRTVENINSLGSHRFTVQVDTTGVPTTATVRLEGRLKGSTRWTDLSGDQAAGGAGGGFTFHIVNKPVDEVRVVLAALSGGTTPTATARLEISNV